MTRRGIAIAAAVAALAVTARAAEEPAPDAISDALRQELDRSLKGLSLGTLARPYYLAYWVRDQREVTIQATFGSLTRSSDHRTRVARVDLRVGDPSLDNSGFFAKDRSLATSPMVELPLDDDPLAVRRVLWFQTDRLYKSAAQTLEAKKAYLAQKSGELKAPDFTPEDPVHLVVEHEPMAVDLPAWEKRVRDLSAILRRYPAIQQSDVVFFVRDRSERLLSSEGSSVRSGEASTGLEVSATAMAADGMELQDFAVAYGGELERTVDKFPATVTAMAERLQARTRAPMGDDYLGPVLLEDQAACEFVGQLLVPGLSGEKTFVYEDERFGGRGPGQPLQSRMNRRILPVFLSVVDDPKLQDVGGVKLVGGYVVDQEGIPAEKVSLVEKGILKSLLMTRAPLEKIRHSNGHARAESGMPGPRTSNLVVSNEQPASRKELHAKLLELVKAQELPYGIIMRKLNDELLEGRNGPGGRITSPIEVYRLYPDGHEEEVRGMAWGEVGIHVLRDILAAGDKPYVYDYYQSGHGGTVPTSIVSPALLLDEIELKSIDQSQDKPPVLPSPLAHATEMPPRPEEPSGARGLSTP